ncbi:MAG: type I-G CRISPR-associated helicase/endonuclease Cas3g [Candidatus Nanopelagicales bacterium]
MSFPNFFDFFTAATGRSPYAWQQRLADHLQEHGHWPWHVDVPTGLGKTSCIDIAVYDLARQAHLGRRRTAPQRIFHVVDRRTIIDSTVEHTRQLAQRIAQAASGPLVTIREALSVLEGAGSDEVIHVTGIHGQDADDLQWMQRVTGCSIVSLTSHQFVSRLLLRGYGVSPGNRPVAAAVCAIDRLVLFDEPHLSSQAVHTILAAERLQERAQESLGLPRSATVLLGATVPAHLRELRTTAIRVQVEDESDGARQRLHARRPTMVDWVTGNDAALSKALVSAARDLVKSGAQRTVVFANTVGTAQEVCKALSGNLGSSEFPVPVRLVTSRFRSWDKPLKKDLEGPGVVVTTQTLEVGVDLSFDALVTEVCPWSSLLQRLGRFNRYGECNGDEAFERRKAVVVAGWDAERGEPSSRKASVSIYGADSLNMCARVLRNLTEQSDDGVVDMSPSHLKSLGVDEGALDPGQLRVGTLTSAMLPLMAQTRPTPEADVPVAALISGPDAEVSSDVEVAWRHQLDIFDIPGLTPSVSTEEVVSVSRTSWAAFIAGDKSPVENLPDVESAFDRPRTVSQVEDLRKYRVWDHGEEQWAVPSTARQLARSNRVIISSVLGGYTPELGWTGLQGQESDLDISWETALADIGRQAPGRRVDLIIRRDHLLEEAAADTSEVVENLLEALDDVQDQLSSGIPADETDTAGVVKAAPCYVKWRISMAKLASGHTAAQKPQAASLSFDPDIRILSPSGPEVVIARVQVNTTRHDGPVGLEEHQAQVGTWAGADAATLGLDDDLVAEIVYAGTHHDDGKNTDAFQRYILDGDPPGTKALAKSSRPPGSAPTERRRRADAGIPIGWRHEAESVGHVFGSSMLVRHLVGSHHGWFRPVIPPTAYASDADQYPLPVEHADDFNLLNERFGVWGLAYLESLVRMADWRASARPWSSSQVRVPVPKISSASTSSMDSPTVSRNAHSFPGLHTHPMTGWFAAVGLLAAASGTDAGARLHWEPLPSDATGTPLVTFLTTSEEPEKLVRRILESTSWRSAGDLADELLTKSSLTAKYQKVGPASALHGLLRRADEQQNWLLLGLVNDLVPAEASSNVPLAMAPFANMASYVKVAFDRVNCGRGLPAGVVDVLGALTTVSAGFAHDKCDGGMDRNLGNAPGVNGLGDPVTRLSRSALAPLALYGIASLGVGPLRGMGVVSADEVVLPLSTAGQTFTQLRALTYLGHGPSRWDWMAAGLGWTYSAQQQRPTDKESVWSGQARLRN